MEKTTERVTEGGRRDLAADPARRSRLVAAGGLFAAVGASSCCVIPFGLALLGVGGAWLGNLTRLAPYQPILLALALPLLVVGWLLHRRARLACADGPSCSRPRPDRLVRLALWVASALTAAAIAFPYVTRPLLD